MYKNTTHEDAGLPIILFTPEKYSWVVRFLTTLLEILLVLICNQHLLITDLDQAIYTIMISTILLLEI